MLEIILDIWFLAFAYDELGEFIDAGSIFYAVDIWNGCDIIIILIGLAYMITSKNRLPRFLAGADWCRVCWTLQRQPGDHRLSFRYLISGGIVHGSEDMFPLKFASLLWNIDPLLERNVKRLRQVHGSCRSPLYW